MWIFKTKIGILWIRKRVDGRFELGINNKGIGSYHEAWAAADDVYCKATGYINWSRLKDQRIPRDLSEWEFISTF